MMASFRRLKLFMGTLNQRALQEIGVDEVTGRRFDGSKEYEPSWAVDIRRL